MWLRVQTWDIRPFSFQFIPFHSSSISIGCGRLISAAVNPTCLISKDSVGESFYLREVFTKVLIFSACTAIRKPASSPSLVRLHPVIMVLYQHAAPPDDFPVRWG